MTLTADSEWPERLRPCVGSGRPGNIPLEPGPTLVGPGPADNHVPVYWDLLVLSHELVSSDSERARLDRYLPIGTITNMGSVIIPGGPMLVRLTGISTVDYTAQSWQVPPWRS